MPGRPFTVTDDELVRPLRHRPATATALAERFGVTRQAIHKRLLALEAEGRVTRHPTWRRGSGHHLWRVA